MRVLFGLLLFLGFQQACAAKSEPGSRLTYDVGLSNGSYSGSSYSEMNLGLNWFLSDWMIWRNSLFSRTSSATDNRASGLDSSLRFQITKNEGDLGLQAFAGPGYRFSSTSHSAVFAEAGATVRIKGLTLGVGAKTMVYTNPGDDSTGTKNPTQDTSYFIILGGGGSL